jgi:hypothetical protein
MTYDAILSLARSMYLSETPRGVFEAEDETVIAYWMRRARLRESAHSPSVTMTLRSEQEPGSRDS